MLYKNNILKRIYRKCLMWALFTSLESIFKKKNILNRSIPYKREIQNLYIQTKGTFVGIGKDDNGEFTGETVLYFYDAHQKGLPRLEINFNLAGRVIFTIYDLKASFTELDGVDVVTIEDQDILHEVTINDRGIFGLTFRKVLMKWEEIKSNSQLANY